jgi:hypothetical protein
MHDKEAQGHSHYIVKLVPFSKSTELKISVFRDIMPCNPLKVNRSCGRICRLHIQGWRVSQQAVCFKLGFSLGSIFSPEDGGDKYFRKWTAWHYIREDRTRHNRRCDNLKSLLLFFSLALQPPWALASSFQFHDHFYRRWDSLDQWSARRKAST